MEPIGVNAFWTTISILLRNYHAINKNIFECLTAKVFRVIQEIELVDESPFQSLQNAAANCFEEIAEKDVAKCIQEFTTANGFLLHLKLLTKRSGDNILANGIIDAHKQTFTCKFQSNTYDDYTIRLAEGKIVVDIISQRTNIEISSRWCENILLPKLLKWARSLQTDDSSNNKAQIQSIQLVEPEAYNNLYKELKQKYAEKTLKFWADAQESTDPLKFIYEDLAIASYLITLWQKYSKPIAFADLGCGNGLLVHILNEEGFEGYGYDIRARKLWSLYPTSTSTHLFEQPIEPRTFKAPAEVDWLIGNHSDELSPWLPVVAALASYDMHYFLLPCCAYEFSGNKFQRRTSNKSAYQDFFAYTESISHTCGFITLQDRLKIPSTKRLALIGVERAYARCEQQNKCTEIMSFVKEEMEKYGGAGDDVKLRDKHETVRNCTQIDRVIINSLVLKIFHIILFNNTIDNDRDENDWKIGGRLSLSEIANRLSKTDLQQIKSECGGIKTLLRNKHEIFEFFPDQLIGLRKPTVRTSTNANRMLPVKRRHCFFKQHHPNGCPLTNEQCTFLH